MLQKKKLGMGKTLEEAKIGKTKFRTGQSSENVGVFFWTFVLRYAIHKSWGKLFLS